ATTTSATEAIADFACGATFADAPDALYERATRAFIDTIGVAIAARHEGCFTILAETLGLGRTTGDATVLPTRTRASAAQAAFVNGTAGHALDYDDVADEIHGHPSIVLVAPLLAVAEARHATGRQLLEAYALGFDVSCAVARGLPVEPHYLRGWHATATVGILGAVAAAGHLLGLDQLTIQQALGIAGSMAGGSRQNFGTMTKPLHAGLASRDAVLATQLAANGFTADPHQLEGRIGYFQMFGADPQLDEVQGALERPSVLLARGLSVKKFPCCFGTHRMANAALTLQAAGLRAADVSAIDVSVSPGGLEAIIHHQPKTGLQGKFSGEYVVAACLLDGRVGLSTFSDEAVCRSSAQDLLSRVTIREAKVPPFGAQEFDHAYATLDVALRDGSRLRQRCDIPAGDARAPLTDAELDAKFRDCVAFSESGWDADALLSRLWALRDAEDVATLF
ncbi:MAG TPA: MmgE/PrpD family protein, partial [Chloroflexota bacterium]